MNKRFLQFTAIVVSLSIAACGGGGGEDSSPANPGTPTPPANSSSLNEIPLQLAPGQNAYPLASFESQTFERINRARTECGFGALTQDQRLDRAAEGHAKYVLSKDAQLGHDQFDTASLFFTGRSPEARAIAAGYLNSNQSNGLVSEGLSGGQGSTLRNGDKSITVFGLLNAPYHALDLLAPRQHVGISIQWPAKAGVPDRMAGFMVEDTVLVVKTGTPMSNGKTTVQQLPANELLSWPCNATTVRLPNGFGGEVPDPFNGSRDFQAKPVGSPFYLMARHGSKLRVTSAKLTNLTTGRVVPLLPPRHADTEIYPGTTSLFSHANLMDWAFIFPDERLEAGAPGVGDSRMRMEVTATVNGKPISKTVEYTVSNGGPDR
jgi:hypothetical protein